LEEGFLILNYWGLKGLNKLSKINFPFFGPFFLPQFGRLLVIPDFNLKVPNFFWKVPCGKIG